MTYLMSGEARNTVPPHSISLSGDRLGVSHQVLRAFPDPRYIDPYSWQVFQYTLT